MHLSCFAFAGEKKGFSRRGKFYPSIKIASSRAFSSWNCRSMSTPSSWKSGTSSSAGAQYPRTNNVSRYSFSALYLLFFPLAFDLARAFLYTFTKLCEGSFRNSTGAWHVATRHLFCHAYASRVHCTPRTPRIQAYKKVKNIILRLCMG